MIEEQEEWFWLENEDGTYSCKHTGLIIKKHAEGDWRIYNPLVPPLFTDNVAGLTAAKKASFDEAKEAIRKAHEQVVKRRAKANLEED